MTRTIDRIVYPMPDPARGVPGLHAAVGKHPSEPLPLRWLETLVADIRNWILANGGTEQEADGAVVYGVAELRVQYPDQLTPTEVMRDDLAERDRVLGELRKIFGAYTESKDPGILKIRDLLGIPPGQWPNAPGQPAAPIGPAVGYRPDDPLGPPPLTDAERRAKWLDALANGGWKFPADARIITRLAGEHAIDLATAERWMGLEQGAIGSAVAAEMASRGLAA